MEERDQKAMFAALSERGREFAFRAPPRGRWEALAQRLGLAPRVRRLRSGPITLGARARCAAHLNRASLDRYSEMTVQRAAMLFAERETDGLVMFLATALWNREDGPPGWLPRAIRGLDQRGLDEVLSHVRGSLDVSAFLNSIISATGVSLQPEETIAPDGEARGPTR